jgi:bifunctional DNA-binding transcriptional regulator/antitoxin component of YhaV-PrlF toxin-antitoxin module
MSSHTITRKLTSKGQVTVPVEVRNILGSDYIVFEIIDGQVVIKPVEMDFEQAYGSVPVPPHMKNMSDKEIGEIIEDEVAQKYVKSNQ